MTTLVLQSHRADVLAGWQGRCCATVEAWAQARGFAYERCSDELFDLLPDAPRERHGSQPVVLSDLARLYLLREGLERGFEQVIWCDADLLLWRDFAPAAGDRFGRECWVQRESNGSGLRSYRKIHNAWLQFHRASPVLPFYIDRAETLLQRASSPVVPQFIGPKLLTAWHNIAPFAVEERIGMLSPLGMAELLQDSPPRALKRLLAGHDEALCGLNLSASCEGREQDGVKHDAADYGRLIDGLLRGDLRHRLARQVD